MDDIKLPDLSKFVGLQLPGEGFAQAVSSISNAISVARQTMSQENRDSFDKIRIVMARNIHNVGVDLWTALGIKGLEKV